MRTQPRHKDGCSVVFFRRKQDAVQERHTLSDCCLLLVWPACSAPRGQWSGLDCWCWACQLAQRKVQPSPADSSRAGFLRQPRLSTLTDPGSDLMRGDLL